MKFSRPFGNPVYPILLCAVLPALGGCSQQPSKTAPAPIKQTPTMAGHVDVEASNTRYPTIESAEDDEDDDPVVDAAAAQKLSGDWHWLGNLTPTETLKIDKPAHYRLSVKLNGWFEVQADCIKGEGLFEAVGNRIALTVVQQAAGPCSPAHKDLFIASLEAAGTFRVVGDKLRLRLRREKREMVFYRPE